MLRSGSPADFEFGDDALGDAVAEFDAPLVEGIDVPEDALGEDAHFVGGDEASEGGGGEFVGARARGVWNFARPAALLCHQSQLVGFVRKPQCTLCPSRISSNTQRPGG